MNEKKFNNWFYLFGFLLILGCVGLAQSSENEQLNITEVEESFKLKVNHKPVIDVGFKGEFEIALENDKGWLVAQTKYFNNQFVHNPVWISKKNYELCELEEWELGFCLKEKGF